jgi:beta-ribofuranosylaminobenzene 5'-phosphate synthase
MVTMMQSDDEERRLLSGSAEIIEASPIDASPAARVEVAAPARLHLGFLDLNGGLGRNFGGVGLAIEGFATRLRLSPGEGVADRGIAVQGPGAERAGECLARACLAFGLAQNYRLVIESAIPPHAGLGSGTQLGLAVATALARLRGVALSTTALAMVVARGARSGIGIGAFERGGLLVDGGRGPAARQGKRPAPIIARLDFPPAWRLLLTLDRAREGLHGAAEKEAFAALPPFAEALAERLCRLLAMRLLPGVADADFAAASAALGEVQSRLGDYFAPAQNGPYRSPAVAAAQDWLAAEGLVGLGQSSWGPTGFALIESPEQGAALLRAARERFKDQPSLEFRLVEGRNRGAEIALTKDEERPKP